MKNILKLFVFFIMIGSVCQAKAQSESPMKYLEDNFPKLTEKFSDELNKYAAHYIFAVDVSGSMAQYEGMVARALKPFFQALPDNDRVDVIPFGTYAQMNLMGYGGVINQNVKKTLCSNVETMYTHRYGSQQQDHEFKSNTDIQQAVEAVAKSIENNKGYEVNVVIILTDFRNDKKSVPEARLSDDELKNMRSRIEAVTGDVYTRFIALELPVRQNAPGYCLDQLSGSVFSFGNNKLETAQIGNDQSAIEDWFEQLKRDIMTTKLKAIVHKANKETPVSFTVQTDIDGNVTAEINWTPNKLYEVIQIDSTYVDAEGFYFENNTANYTKMRDSAITLELGQIKHEKYGFHNFDGNIHLGLSLPTEFDDELKALEAEKPLPTTTVHESRLVFTFFLTFKTTVIIIAIIILYILGVIMAIKRNAKLRFKGNITFYDNAGNQIGEMVRMPEQPSSATIIFGKGGTGRCKVDNAEWQFVIQKKNGNPFLLFAKPRFVWRSTIKHVAQGKKKSGEVNGSLLVACGSSGNDLTHKVRISNVPTK